MAKLHFKFGAMNSGKSDTLIKTAYNYRERGLEIVTIKPALDTRDAAVIIARGGAARVVDITASPSMNLRSEIKQHEVRANIRALHCVLVDESQFLETAQIDQLYQVAKFDAISVICYGLRTDFMTELFPGSRRLFEIADNFEKLPTMCRCGAQAELNCRSVDGAFVFTGDQVAIEGQGDVTYESLCGECYYRERRLAGI